MKVREQKEERMRHEEKRNKGKRNRTETKKGRESGKNENRVAKAQMQNLKV